VDAKKQLVRVDFEFEPGDRRLTGSTCRSGWAVFDTKRYWLIKEAETDTAADPDGPNGKFKMKNEFNNVDFPLPYVSHHVCDVFYPKSKTNEAESYRTISDTELHDLPNVDQKRFTLSDIGIPEPVDDLDGVQFDISPKTVDLGEVLPKTNQTLTFTIKNNGDKPIRILGCNTIGSCSLVNVMPIDLPPNASDELSVEVYVDEEGGSFQRVFLFIDDGKLRTVNLDIRAKIIFIPTQNEILENQN
jgi:hypothetical protein